MAGRGITKNCLHVDRKDETKGYVPGNLQILTNSKNIQKYLTWDHGQRGKPTNFRVAKRLIDNEENYPF